MQLLEIEKLEINAEGIAVLLDFINKNEDKMDAGQSGFYRTLAEHMQWAATLPAGERPEIKELAELCYNDPKPAGGKIRYSDKPPVFRSVRGVPNLPPYWRMERVQNPKLIKVLICDGREVLIRKGQAKDLLGAQRTSGGAPEIVYNLLQKLSTVDGREWQPGELQELPMCCYTTLCEWLAKLNFHSEGGGNLSVGP